MTEPTAGDERRADAKAQTHQRTEWVWATSYLLLVVSLISLTFYTRSIDQAGQACINRVVQSNTLTSENRLAAATEKDTAELERLSAEGALVASMLPENAGYDPVPSARALLLAIDTLIVELNDVIATRKANPVPNYENYCRDTAEATPTPTATKTVG